MGGWLFGDALGRALAIFGAGLGGFISWRLSRRDPAGGRQTMMFKKTLACSFCGRTEADVEKLVAGPRVFICDRCAAEVMRIMNESGPGRSLTGTSPDSPRRAPLKRLHGWWRRGARRSRPSAGQL